MRDYFIVENLVSNNDKVIENKQKFISSYKLNRKKINLGSNIDKKLYTHILK